MAELKIMPVFEPEPEKAKGGFMTFQESIRPFITLIMTLVFAAILVGAAFGFTIQGWESVFTVFMATYGTVLGFWFGERSALKVPGKDNKGG